MDSKETILHYEILDENRKNILPLLREFKNEFYLAGGTGLALLLGHRDSVDFDFFTTKHIDTAILFKKCQGLFVGYSLEKIQEEKDTLSILINGEIKLSFFCYAYPVFEKVESDFFDIASVADIGAMKLSAVMSRSLMKDFVDLYFIIKNISLVKVLDTASEKFKPFNTMLALKNLVYFEDVVSEPILFKNNKDVSFEDIKSFLREEVSKALK